MPFTKMGVGDRGMGGVGVGFGAKAEFRSSVLDMLNLRCE